MAGKQPILGDEHGAPAARCGPEYIGVKRVTAHGDTLGPKRRQRRLEKIIHLSERLAEELDMIWKRVSNLMTEMAWNARKYPSHTCKQVLAGNGRRKIL